MPKFLKNDAILLLDGGVESYILGLYGMTTPSLRVKHKAETKYAPVIGLYGAAAELLVKACLVQANGLCAMYKNEDITSGVYRFGNEVVDDFKKLLKDDDERISYLWKSPEEHSLQKEQLLFCLNKFKLLQELRASGLHAGVGCSRDVTVSTAIDIYSFIQLLLQSKKLKPYLRNIPEPESTIRDREVIIEDLTRRLNSTNNKNEKANCLRNMYMVLPYIPEMKPDWIDAFDRIAVSPPTDGDLSYLAKILSDAHSIYLLKNRGGKDGVPVRIDPQNPDALPIAIQNIKRTLSTTPDKFSNDILTANTRLNEGRLDLPIDEFIVDLYALGLNEAQVLTAPDKKLTAQQVWPFVASAYSTMGTPRPCWFLIRVCDELDQLIAYVKKAGQYGNGYLSRRLPDLVNSLVALKNNSVVAFPSAKDTIFKEILPYKKKIETFSDEQIKPFTPSFLKRYPLSSQMSELVSKYVSGNKNAGDTLSAALEMKELSTNDHKAVLALLPLCYDGANRNGLISMLRTHHLQAHISQARKMMFFSDFIENGPKI